MTKKIILSVLILHASAPLLLSSQFSSCRVTKSSSSVSLDLSFDGAFSVKGASYREGRLFMPFDGYGGREYDNVRLLSKEIYLLAERSALEGSCAGNGSYKKPELRVIGLDRLKSPARVANVSFIINGDFNVIAGIIKRKDGNFWVAYPKGFSFLKKEDKACADAFLISHYRKAE